jgi:hypothetical protein
LSLFKSKVVQTSGNEFSRSRTANDISSLSSDVLRLGEDH